ncbi:unnamed protein product [Miscanthus lutarioriparius]|uniref:Uncharacterized protein n=1 Tax=Miscanthus lutarioriparius TaxID=422564 RepID=A0A811RV70_9POAL|nr:unnamed protein product [Miscanthus lutarioriparius]
MAAAYLLAQLVLGGEVAVVAEAFVKLPLHLTGAAGASGPVLRDRDLDGRPGHLRRGGRRATAEPASEGLLDVLGRGRRREWAAEELTQRGRRGRRRQRDAAGEPEGLLAQGLPAAADHADVAPTLPPRRVPAGDGRALRLPPLPPPPPLLMPHPPTRP